MWEKHIVGLYISKYRVVKKKKKISYSYWKLKTHKSTTAILSITTQQLFFL